MDLDLFPSGNYVAGILFITLSFTGLVPSLRDSPAYRSVVLPPTRHSRYLGAFPLHPPGRDPKKRHHLDLFFVRADFLGLVPFY